MRRSEWVLLSFLQLPGRMVKGLGRAVKWVLGPTRKDLMAENERWAAAMKPIGFKAEHGPELVSFHDEQGPCGSLPKPGPGGPVTM